ncbi:hypothetical protein [Bacteroides sp.]|uniref:hypothetical protein n=1 Tax=Bacteroides sp. TaxID=29523 RepID=UPI00262CD713|nr:hypothetical protein [Bacteroides sp.]MDD3040389.1 hypothetical protein [Bacteroides sp.]
MSQQKGGNMNKYKPFIIILIVFGILSYVGFTRVTLLNSIKQAENKFITALVTGNMEEAKKHADGKVLWHLNSATLPKAKLENIETSVVAYSNNWAQVDTTVEFSVNGINDIGWYRVELAKTGGWKVISIRQTDCPVFGRGSKISEQDLESIKRVFADYLEKVKTNDFKDIGKYLAGPARSAHEAHQTELSSPLIQQYSNLTIKPLWIDGKTALVKCTYKVDDRDAEVIAGFYKTSQGWKLVKI